MSTQRSSRILNGAGDARWRTVATVRTVLVIVHSVTALNRFEDILSVFDSDRRIQLLFTFPDAAVVSSDIEDDLSRRGALVISWPTAINGEFDLALSAHHSGELHRIRAPLAVLSHGLGYTKFSNRQQATGNRQQATYGLSKPWLLHEGKVVPAAVVLSHTEQYDRLSETVPEALSAAVIAGDPCFDRMLASTHRRSRYRRALGVEDRQRLVTITSTWGPRSLFGSNRDLISQLTAELDLDDHAVAVIIHPNTWFAHGPAQIRLWLADTLRAGIRLIPPGRGWQQTIIASDIVIGDHGAVTGYAAALGRPTLLASFPAEDVVAESAVGALGRAATRLHHRGAFKAQIDAAVEQSQADRFAEVRELTTSAAGEASTLLRKAFYGLMKLAEPGQPALIPSYEPADLQPETMPLRAWWASTATHPDGSVIIRRWPADLTTQEDPSAETHERHLVVSVDHPRRNLSTNAGICVLDDSADISVHQVFRDRPACNLVAVRVSTTTCSVTHRSSGTLIATLRSDHQQAIDPVMASSAIYHHLAESNWLSLPESLDIRAGAGHPRVEVVLSRSDSAVQ